MQFENKIQEKITKTCAEAGKVSGLVLKIPHQIQTYEVNDYLVVQKNIDVLFSTIILFLEQDPLTNIAMNLDVNFRKVQQETFIQPGEQNLIMKDALWEENGATSQNSPIHLLFYKKVPANQNSASLNTAHESPVISLMSLC